MSIAAARLVEDARDVLAVIFNIADPGRIAITRNATEALNLAIYGLVQPGDHVVTTSIEHNSVMRPLRHLESLGLELTVVDALPNGTVSVDDVQQAIRDDTRLLVTLHGSNVTGALLPVKELAEIARAHGIPYLVDISQTAGVFPIDVEAWGVDMLAFTDHKGLLGMTGTGGPYVREGLSLRPLLRGGTGSNSVLETQPDFMPDAYESGTANVAGLAGLAAGVRYILDVGVEQIMRHEQ